jgi:hypothetical protein
MTIGPDLQRNFDFRTDNFALHVIYHQLFTFLDNLLISCGERGVSREFYQWRESNCDYSVVEWVMWSLYLPNCLDWSLNASFIQPETGSDIPRTHDWCSCCRKCRFMKGVRHVKVSWHFMRQSSWRALQLIQLATLTLLTTKWPRRHVCAQCYE